MGVGDRDAACPWGRRLGKSSHAAASGVLDRRWEAVSCSSNTRKPHLTRAFEEQISATGALIERDVLRFLRQAVGDRYKIDREVARGGAARVFRATDANGAVVALKVLHPQLAVTVSGDRFLREISFLSHIDHPHIAKFLDSGETDLLIYYAMTYVEGPTLREHLKVERRMSVSDTLSVARDLLDALDYAHREGILHRDVKPENIVLSPNGPVIVDFGIARAAAEAAIDKLTRSGFSVGTSSYMSPEQIEGDIDIDGRTDLYSLGCVLFECLTGRPPFTAAREEQIRKMHVQSTAPDVRTVRKDVPESVAGWLGKALATAREDRWSSASEMGAAIVSDSADGG